MLSEDQKKNLIQTINSKVATLTCPMCKNHKFVLADGYFNNPMQTDFSSISIGGPSIPSIAIVCSNCGFISQHALGVLGKLPQQTS